MSFELPRLTVCCHNAEFFLNYDMEGMRENPHSRYQRVSPIDYLPLNSKKMHRLLFPRITPLSSSITGA